MALANELELLGLKVWLQTADKISPRLASSIAYRIFNTPFGARTERLRDNQLAESRSTLAMAEALDLKVDRLTVRLYHWKADRYHAPASGAPDDRPEHPRRRRRTVLLTHGWTLGARYMTYFVEPLVVAGFDVVAIDLPGHGASSSTRRAAPDAVKAILEASKALGGFDAAVGHSFGASMVVMAAEHDSSLALDRIVLLASADRLADIVSRFCDELKLTTTARERLVRMLENMGGRSLDSVSVSRAMRSLGVPTLVVHDPSDRVVPFADAERIASMPRTTLFRADGLGHMRILRSGRVAETVVRFLTAS